MTTGSLSGFLSASACQGKLQQEPAKQSMLAQHVLAHRYAHSHYKPDAHKKGAPRRDTLVCTLNLFAMMRSPYYFASDAGTHARPSDSFTRAPWLID